MPRPLATAKPCEPSGPQATLPNATFQQQVPKKGQAGELYLSRLTELIPFGV
jgi:hypothetical protein